MEDFGRFEVSKGDNIAEISTDKVDMDLDSPFTGKIIKLNVEEGSVISVGDTLAEIDTEEESLWDLSLISLKLTLRIYI